MPLPFILGGLAIAAVGTGVVKGAGGYIDKSDADDILKEVKRIHDTANKNIETAQNDCTRSLGELGKLYLEIGQDFNEFQTLAKQLINQIENSNNSHLKVNIPKLSLAKIESISLNSAAFLGKMVGGAAGGAAAAYAVYGGVMSLAAASTGTAISSLSVWQRITQHLQQLAAARLLLVALVWRSVHKFWVVSLPLLSLSLQGLPMRLMVQKPYKKPNKAKKK